MNYFLLLNLRDQNLNTTTNMAPKSASKKAKCAKTKAGSRAHKFTGKQGGKYVLRRSKSGKTYRVSV